MIKNAGKTAAAKAENIKKNPAAFMESLTVHVTRDNGKTGIESINLLAGGADHTYTGACTAELKAAIDAAGGACRGTCDGDCPGCYAKKMTRYPDVFINMVENTILARKDPAAFWNAVEKELYSNGKSPAVVRLHDSGDFLSYDYFAAACEFMARHPETKFGAYTKQADIVYRYGLDNLPANFSLQCSPWPGYCEPIGDLPQFCYDNGTDPELAKLPHCPAVDKHGNRTGVQCKDCLYCYNAKRGQRRAVYAH